MRPDLLSIPILLALGGVAHAQAIRPDISTTLNQSLLRLSPQDFQIVAPDEMIVGETVPVEVTFQRVDAGPEPADMTFTVTVTLTGTGMTVHPLGSAVQSVPPGQTVRWAFEATPRSAGRRVLELSSSAKASSGKITVRQRIPPVEHDVRVEMTFLQALHRWFLGNFWLVVAGTALVLAGSGVLARWRFSRKTGQKGETS